VATPERAGPLDRALSPTNDLPACADRAWTKSAVCRLEADVSRSSDTHLIPLRVPALDGLHLYFKDESTHPTGSLKHRLARSLFLFAICNGWIHEGTPVVEASSGSTAVSEAYFARLLDLPFYAVMPAGTSPEKVAAIEFYGGRCHFVDEPAALYDESRRLARELGGHYLDQFTYAERATDWRGNNNIAESMFGQMRLEPFPVPSWVVMSAGTGGTSATIGRYIRYRHLDTKLCVVDVENSVFYDNVAAGCDDLVTDQGSLIEGIGRPRLEPSFIPTVVDHMLKVPDAASLAAMRVLSACLRRRGRRFLGHQLLRPVLDCCAHAGGRRERFAGDADLRLRRALRRYLFQQRPDRGPWPRPDAVHQPDRHIPRNGHMDGSRRMTRPSGPGDRHTIDHPDPNVRADLQSILDDGQLSRSDKLDKLLSYGIDAFGLPIGIVSRIEHGTYTVLNAKSPGGQIAPGTQFELGITYCVDTIASEGPVAFTHVFDTDRRSHPAYKEFKLESYIGAPVLVRGKAFGTINFSSPDVRPGLFEQPEIDTIRALADAAGRILESAPAG